MIDVIMIRNVTYNYELRAMSYYDIRFTIRGRWCLRMCTARAAVTQLATAALMLHICNFRTPCSLLFPTDFWVGADYAQETLLLFHKQRHQIPL